ncbi:MAG: lactate dehydrogenase [Lachnospiraceae bacterium]|nr:lactate dehydrogenase [Lachnospiraceae bacterium]
MKIFAYALRDYDEKQYFLQCAEEFGFEYGYTDAYPDMENAELARGYDGVTIITNPVPAELMDRFYELGVRCIATRSIGFEHIDTAHAKEIGMGVTHVSYSPNSVANYTIMLMLAACRKFPAIMERGALQDFTLKGKIGKELSRCTVGVIGTGRIGETVARRLAAFDCRVLAYDVYQKESVKAYAEYVELPELYAQSDIITLHVPGNDSSYHMIGADEITQMKDGVILVNAARGMLIDTPAMIAGLESGKIGFAALDTIEQEAGLYYLDRQGEVLDNHDRAMLLAMPNVILSSHMAFYTEEAVEDMVKNAVLGLLKHLRGEENEFAV